MVSNSVLMYKCMHTMYICSARLPRSPHFWVSSSLKMESAHPNTRARTHTCICICRLAASPPPLGGKQHTHTHTHSPDSPSPRGRDTAEITRLLGAFLTKYFLCAKLYTCMCGWHSCYEVPHPYERPSSAPPATPECRPSPLRRRLKSLLLETSLVGIAERCWRTAQGGCDLVPATPVHRCIPSALHPMISNFNTNVCD
jgi:hypothetical protein